MGKHVFRRVIIFSAITALVFGLFEPGASLALAQSNENKTFNTDYDLKPLTSDKQETQKAEPTQQQGAPDTKQVDNPKGLKYEEENKRTAFTSSYVNNDGTHTMKYSVRQQNYKEGNSWKKIDNTVKPVEKPKPQANFFQIMTNSQPEAPTPDTYTGKAGSISVEMKPLSEGMTFQAEGKTFTMRPIGASDVTPVKQDDNSVLYKDAWPNVDLVYELRGEVVKEAIIIKDKSAQATYNFSISGGKVINHPTKQGELTIEGLPADFSFSQLTLDLHDRGVISEQRVTQTPTQSGDGIAVNLDANWLKSQPNESFPMRVDPSFWKDSTSYKMYKSDGYSCNMSNCYANIGSIYDSGWKVWRSYVMFPISELSGKRVLNAYLHGSFVNGANGDTGPHWIYAGRANCDGYMCQGTQVGASGNVYGDFDVDFTNGLQTAINQGDWTPVWSLWGEEGSYKTFKPYYDIAAAIVYDSPTPTSNQMSPADGQVMIDTQPTLKGATVTDPDGPVQYQFALSSSAGALNGAVINSGWLDTPQWTVPDGVLQDGTTYYWRIQTKDTTTTGQVTSGPTRSLKVDFRNGKDSTQTYDTVGPVGINLATGSASVETGSHTMSALGGSMGVNLSYDTPNRAQKGLKAEYWNVASNYSINSGAPTSTPTLSRIDPDINFDWSTASPGANIGTDNWYARWTGKMVVPSTGSYTFGASYDDEYSVYINGNKVAGNGCCSQPNNYANSTPVSLTAGQVVDLRVEYHEATSVGFMKLFVKGPVDEQPVPKDWLKTDNPNGSKLYGLFGRYYTDNAYAHDLDAAAQDPSRLMIARQDTKMNLDLGPGSVIPAIQGDNFMARWTGYITVPTSGDYQLGAVTDDGLRIKLNNGLFGAQNTIIDSWKDQTATLWSGNTHLDANTPVPITIDWYEHNNNATMKLLVRGNGYTDQEIPVTWLTPQANAVPEGWQLNLDVDGNVGYERLRVSGNSVILQDASRNNHEYTSTGTGYKPPVNEDGVLVKNSDNTYTFTDVDGRVYIFDAAGLLKSVTTPADDRQPAALKYEYGGDPSRLLKITDGVNSARYATLHYKGIQDDNMCGHPSGFDDAPTGMLCAFKSSDGDVTHFYYQAGQLARVEKPGNDITDYRYNTKGQIDTIRDGLAGDVIAAGLRADDETVTTKLSYDDLGRITSVKAPAATAGADRLEHTFSYKPSDTIALNRLYRASGPTNDILTSATRLADSQYDTMSMVYALRSQAPGSHPIYACKRSDGFRYVTNAINCPVSGDTNIGTLGYLYDTPTGAATKPMSRLKRTSDNYVLEYPVTSLAGWNTDEFLGYGFDSSTNAGISEMHITNAPEPQGFSKRLEYDSLLRTSKATDLTGKTTSTEWDSVKDLQLSTTDATGLKSTSLYDADDRLVDSYGPAPASWYGSDRKPTAIYTNQVPHTSTGFDEGISGLAVSAYPNKKLIGTPKYVTTGFNTPPTASYALPISNGIVTASDGLSIRATGKIRLDQVGTYSFRLMHADGVRLYIDDQLVTGDWTDGNDRLTGEGTFTNQTANSSHRITIEAYRASTASTERVYAMLSKKAPGASSFDDNVGTMLSPAYNLTTSTTAYDSQIGNITSTTQYKDPAYGQIASTTLDPTGINYQSKAEYEAPGTAFLRQTSKTLPGGAKTTYQHYSKDDTADNPCTTEVEAYHQAGRPKGKVEPTGRTTETVYNESGDVVATRYNSDPWTCTEYDTRGRVTKTTVPGRTENGTTLVGRTITNNYAVSGNPLITSTTDSAGAVTVENDLLGRTVKYTDALGKVTTNSYDTYGKLTSRTSPIGTESYEYDSYDRLTKQKLDNVTFATVTYDDFSRIQKVDYPAGISLSSITRDTLGRENGNTYNLASGQTLADSINRYTSGDIQNGTENGTSKSYTYDKAGRLTNATIGSNTYTYGFGAQNASCPATPNYDAGKDGNRTSMTVNGQTTTYCYNSGDQLVSSSDATLTNAQYDTHGNASSLGDATHKTEFTYDASDRNASIKSGTKETVFVRDAQSRIISRDHRENNASTSLVKYGFTGSGDTPDFLTDNTGNVKQKYLTLPGDVLVTIKTDSQSAGATTYSLPNIHGDVFATVNADGALLNTFMTGAFGETLPNQPAQPTGALGTSATPTNTANGTSYNYVGQHEKLTDLDTSPITGGIIQMGARIYIPTLGRFISVDPIEGGTPNNYAYALDPVNEYDLSGEAIPLIILGLAALVSAVAIASASRDLQNDPKSKSNWANMGLSLVGAGSIGSGIKASGKSLGTAAKKSATSAVRWINSTFKSTNKNNFLRFNTNRIAVGPAGSHYGKPRSGGNIPFHFEINWNLKKVFLENNKTRKTIFCIGRSCYRR
ncbi:MAG TPA: PA14 domain-containing protein [Candidatus Saccharimonadales bacterium]|nr:PA14 domain-containing protein [Candidatus Saccharimonadales bacterium]